MPETFDQMSFHLRLVVYIGADPSCSLIGIPFSCHGIGFARSLFPCQDCI
jgi:hypothetical protein